MSTLFFTDFSQLFLISRTNTCVQPRRLDQCDVCSW